MNFLVFPNNHFYFLRERFVPFLNLPRKDFRPKTQLDSLFPIENRKLIWGRLKTQIGDFVLPELARPTTFSMIKAKFGGSLRSKTRTAQINEALCKVLAHNICVLIQSMHEFRIKIDFGL
jgi:hypothetical protein